MEHILQAASKYTGIDNIEVFQESWTEESASFQSGRLKVIKAGQVEGFGLRMILDGKAGFSGGTNPDPADLAKRAAASAAFSPLALYSLPEDSPMLFSPKIHDPAAAQLTQEDLIETGENIITIIKEHLPEVYCDTGIEKSVYKKRILSGKLDKSYEKTLYNFSLVIHDYQEGDFLSIYDGYSSSALLRKEKEAALRLINLYKLTRKKTSSPSGNTVVLFSPRGFREFIKPLLTGLNGRIIEKGAGMFSGRLGEKVLPEKITITDDGSIDHSPYSAPFDDEGIPIKPHPLIEEGILKNYILDLQTAAALSMKTTGNASRRYPSLPRPSPHAVVIKEGSSSEEDMIKSIKEGIYVDQLIGSHTGNPFSGDFQMNVDLGFKIEKGELTGRIKDTMISGNLYEVFDSLEELSNNQEWVDRCLLPCVVFGKIKSAGK